jgi:hypothetical protein
MRKDFELALAKAIIERPDYSTREVVAKMSEHLGFSEAQALNTLKKWSDAGFYDDALGKFTEGGLGHFGFRTAADVESATDEDQPINRELELAIATLLVGTYKNRVSRQQLYEAKDRFKDHDEADQGAIFNFWRQSDYLIEPDGDVPEGAQVTIFSEAGLEYLRTLGVPMALPTPRMINNVPEYCPKCGNRNLGHYGPVVRCAPCGWSKRA